jgi:hypothetical protein
VLSLQRVLSARQEGEKSGEELLWCLEVGDVAALGYHDTRRAGNVLDRLLRERQEVPKPRELGRFRVLAERDDVVLGTNNEQRGWGDSRVFVPDGLLVDHLEREHSSARPTRVVRTERHSHEDLGEAFPYLWVGMHEVRLYVVADRRWIRPVNLVVVQRLLDWGGIPVR